MLQPRSASLARGTPPAAPPSASIFLGAVVLILPGGVHGAAACATLAAVITRHGGEAAAVAAARWRGSGARAAAPPGVAALALRATHVLAGGCAHEEEAREALAALLTCRAAVPGGALLLSPSWVADCASGRARLSTAVRRPPLLRVFACALR